MCCAPAATCCRISSSTTSRSTTRNAPLYTGTIGQCRHRCLQPRVASVEPAMRCSPPGITTRAYFCQFRHPRAVGHEKFLPRERNDGLLLYWPSFRTERGNSPSDNPRGIPRSARNDAFGDGRCLTSRSARFASPSSNSPAENRAHAEPAQVFFIHRRIKTIETDVRARIHSANRSISPAASRVAVCIGT